MSRAEELVQAYADAVSTHRLESLYGTSKSYTLEKSRERDEAHDALTAELRRLAQVEAEHEALKKAISDAVPVFWYRPVMNGEMYEGPHHNSSIGGKMIREEKPGEWVPLYTLEGIRK